MIRLLQMKHNKTMASQREKLIPLRYFSLRSLSTAEKISVKGKLTAELALVRSAIDKIERIFQEKSNAANTARSSSKQQEVPATRKRKSREITQILKNVNNVNGISDVTTEDSKNSVGAQRKKHCSDSNVGAQRKKHCSDSNDVTDKLRALRAAKLKSRFADTILKAQMELQNIESEERVFRMQREKYKLTKAYNEEKIRIQAQIKAADLEKVESELKIKIKKEREASRLAIENMEATVEIDDFNQVMKELKGLGCQNSSFYVLRQLGLFLKDDDSDDHKAAQISVLTNDEIEEGEICV